MEPPSQPEVCSSRHGATATHDNTQSCTSSHICPLELKAMPSAVATSS